MSAWLHGRALRVVAAAALMGTSACTRFGYDPIARARAPRDAAVPVLDAGAEAGAAPKLDAAAHGPEPAPDAAGISGPAYVDDAGVLVADPVAPVNDRDAAVSASDPGAGEDAGPAQAGGCGAAAAVGGVCWYLAPAGMSCMSFCEGHGGYSPAFSYVGDAAQGGSAARCDSILDLLLGPGAAQSGYRTDGRGLGCHVFSGTRWWLNSGPAFSPLASHPSAQIACSCAGP